MKLLLLTCASFIYAHWLPAQTLDFFSNYNAGGAGALFADVIYDDGKLIVCGQFAEPNPEIGAGNGLLYMELDTNGQVLLTDVYYRPGTHHTPQEQNSMFRHPNGNIYLAYQQFFQVGGMLAGYRNSERIIDKFYPYQGSSFFLRNGIAVGDNLLLAGTLGGDDFSISQVLMLVDSAGNELWNKTYAFDDLNLFLVETLPLESQQYLIPGGIARRNQWARTRITRIDSIGDVIDAWESENFVELGVAARMFITAEGNYLYATHERVNEATPLSEWGTKPKIVCRDTAFNLLWETYLPCEMPTIYDRIRDVIELSDGNYALTGTLTIGGSDIKQIIHKFSPAGETIWTYWHDDIPLLHQWLWELTELPSGSLVATGQQQDVSTGFSTGILLKLSSEGVIDNVTETFINENFAVFPNPTRTRVTVRQPLGQRMKLFSVASGRQVLDIAITDKTAQAIDIGHLPAGTYVLRMREGKLSVSYPIVKIGKGH